MTQTSSLELTPLEESERIQSLDVMRGIVLFGILLMNINAFGLANSYNDPTVAGGFTGWNRLWRNLSYQKIHPIRKKVHMNVTPIYQ